VINNDPWNVAGFMQRAPKGSPVVAYIASGRLEWIALGVTQLKKLTARSMVFRFRPWRGSDGRLP